MTPAPRSTNNVGVLTLMSGAAFLIFPKQLGQAIRGRGASPPPWVVQVLGARYLVQGAAQLEWSRPSVLYGSSLLDALHATSMAAVAARRPAYRRAACGSMALAVISALSTAAVASHTAGR